MSLLAERRERERSPVPKKNARKVGYDVSVHRHVRTNPAGSGGKKFSRVRKGVPGMYVVFCFGRNLSILEATNGLARAKIWIEISCVRVSTNFRK